LQEEYHLVQTQIGPCHLKYIILVQDYGRRLTDKGQVLQIGFSIHFTTSSAVNNIGIQLRRLLVVLKLLQLVLAQGLAQCVKIFYLDFNVPQDNLFNRYGSVNIVFLTNSDLYFIHVAK
jgi:hypothetical protein